MDYGSEEYIQWLNGLKKGDEVYYKEYTFGSKNPIYTITSIKSISKETRMITTLNGLKFKVGRKITKSRYSDIYYIYPVNDEVRIKHMIQTLERTNWESVEIDKLTKMYKILTEGRHDEL